MLPCLLEKGQENWREVGEQWGSRVEVWSPTMQTIGPPQFEGPQGYVTLPQKDVHNQSSQVRVFLLVYSSNRWPAGEGVLGMEV
jgi:hypothetical protein